MLGVMDAVEQLRPVKYGVEGSGIFSLTIHDGSGRELSPWHDVSLHSSNGTFNMVCATPKGAQHDCEVATHEERAPLRTRMRCNKPVNFAEPIPWNYGVLPQTWAPSSQRNSDFGGLPYNDMPVEIVDIGSQVREVGEVYAVEPLAAFALVDPKGFQLSWKIVGIAADDASGFQDLADPNVAATVRTLLDCIQDWLRSCRHCGGEKDKVLAVKSGPASQDKVMTIVAHAHASWQLLRAEQEEKAELFPPAASRKSGVTVRIFAESYATDTANRDSVKGFNKNDLRTLACPVFGSSFISESWDSPDEADEKSERQGGVQDEEGEDEAGRGGKEGDKEVMRKKSRGGQNNTYSRFLGKLTRNQGSRRSNSISDERSLMELAGGSERKGMEMESGQGTFRLKQLKHLFVDAHAAQVKAPKPESGAAEDPADGEGVPRSKSSSPRCQKAAPPLPPPSPVLRPTELTFPRSRSCSESSSPGLNKEHKSSGNEERMEERAAETSSFFLNSPMLKTPPSAGTTPKFFGFTRTTEGSHSSSKKEGGGGFLRRHRRSSSFQDSLVSPSSGRSIALQEKSVSDTKVCAKKLWLVAEEQERGQGSPVNNLLLSPAGRPDQASTQTLPDIPFRRAVVTPGSYGGSLSSSSPHEEEDEFRWRVPPVVLQLPSRSNRKILPYNSEFRKAPADSASTSFSLGQSPTKGELTTSSGHPGLPKLPGKHLGKPPRTPPSHMLCVNENSPTSPLSRVHTEPYGQQDARMAAMSISPHAGLSLGVFKETRRSLDLASPVACLPHYQDQGWGSIDRGAAIPSPSSRAYDIATEDRPRTAPSKKPPTVLESPHVNNQQKVEAMVPAWRRTGSFQDQCSPSKKKREVAAEDESFQRVHTDSIFEFMSHGDAQRQQLVQPSWGRGGAFMSLRGASKMELNQEDMGHEETFTRSTSSALPNRGTLVFDDESEDEETDEESGKESEEEEEGEELDEDYEDEEEEDEEGKRMDSEHEYFEEESDDESSNDGSYDDDEELEEEDDDESGSSYKSEEEALHPQRIVVVSRDRNRVSAEPMASPGERESKSEIERTSSIDKGLDPPAKGQDICRPSQNREFGQFYAHKLVVPSSGSKLNW